LHLAQGGAHAAERFSVAPRCGRRAQYCSIVMVQMLLSRALQPPGMAEGHSRAVQQRGVLLAAVLRPCMVCGYLGMSMAQTHACRWDCGMGPKQASSKCWSSADAGWKHVLDMGKTRHYATCSDVPAVMLATVFFSASTVAAGAGAAGGVPISVSMFATRVGPATFNTHHNQVYMH
jgi:hypothetical protein